MKVVKSLAKIPEEGGGRGNEEKERGSKSMGEGKEIEKEYREETRILLKVFYTP